jgi:N4-gp56 family major capsid protein
MALGTDHVIGSEVPNFIPELWSDEVIAAYKSNLVLGGLVRKMNHRGKKGDTIKIPTPTRGSASSKTAEAQVTLIQHGTDAGLSISIANHKEYSRLVEDIVSVQALESLRSFYTDDAGYAIAKQVDKDLWVEMFNTGSASLTYDAASNELTTASTFDQIREGDGSVWDETTATDISDAGIRTFVKELDDADAPMAGRVIVIPTIVKYDLLGLARFTEQAYTGEVSRGNSIRNGFVGDVYGMDVFVTTNSPLVEDSAGTGDNVSGVCFQADAMVLVEQMGVRSQTQYKQEYLADLYTTDMLYGVKALRDSSIVTFVVPTT